MCIKIICFPVYDVINFETKLNFSDIFGRKSQDKKLNILGMKIASKAKGKAFFIVFKGLSNSIKCLRPQSGPFNTSQINAAIIKKSANLILHCKSID